MIAKIAAAATITHFAHAAGHQNMAKTMTAAANKNRQKQSFMIFPPSCSGSNHDKTKSELIASNLSPFIQNAREGYFEDMLKILSPCIGGKWAIGCLCFLFKAPSAKVYGLKDKIRQKAEK